MSQNYMNCMYRVQTLFRLFIELMKVIKTNPLLFYCITNFNEIGEIDGDDTVGQ